MRRRHTHSTRTVDVDGFGAEKDLVADAAGNLVQCLVRVLQSLHELGLGSGRYGKFVDTVRRIVALEAEMFDSEDRGYKRALLSTLARTRALVREGKL
jgi:hypothetical protein